MEQLPFNSASFDKFCSEKKLMAVKCQKCGNLMVPPRGICINCQSDKLEWVPLSGKGKILSFTVIGVGPSNMLNEGFNRDNPYCSGVIQMDEGPRISTQILGVNTKDPSTIKIGTPVTADFVTRGSFALAPEVACVKKAYLAFKVG
jgi:uncharacterized OB-fold protein